MYGEATLVIVDLPSGRTFTGPEDGISPPGTRSADKADASVPREVTVVVSLGRGFDVEDVAGVEKRGIGSTSVFVTISELSVTNEIFRYFMDYDTQLLMSLRCKLTRFLVRGKCTG